MTLITTILISLLPFVNPFVGTDAHGHIQLDLGYDQHDVAKQYGQKADEAQAKYDNAPRQKINNALGAVGDWVENRANDVAGAATNAYNGARDLAGQAGSAVSNAASSVRDWGAGAVDKGRQAFENLFGKSEPPAATLSSPNNPIQVEQLIPEQRITEQLIPEQRITEQLIPEQRIAEQRTSDNSAKPLYTNSDYLAEQERLRNIVDQQNKNGYSVKEQFNGGTKESYNRGLNSQNNGSKQKNPPNETRAKMAEEMIARVREDPEFYEKKYGEPAEEIIKNYEKSAEDWRSGNYTIDDSLSRKYENYVNDTLARQDANFASTGVANGNKIVDTSRPYHFTLDPNSGQTIVVYDDEKRK